MGLNDNRLSISAGIRYALDGDMILPWTPENISTAAWYDASDADTITIGTTGVSQWDDNSGNGNHATQGTASRQPTYTTNDSIANNKPAIYAPDTTVKFGLYTPSFTSKRVYVVAYYKTGVETTFGNYNQLLGNVLEQTTSFRDKRILGNSSTNEWLTSNEWDGSPRVNGGSETNIALPMPLTILEFTNALDITQGMAIGFSEGQGSQRVWTGGYCEWIFTDGTEDLETRQKIEGYLAWKWGLEANLPIGHPYKNGRPLKYNE